MSKKSKQIAEVKEQAAAQRAADRKPSIKPPSKPKKFTGDKNNPFSQRRATNSYRPVAAPARGAAIDPKTTRIAAGVLAAIALSVGIYWASTIQEFTSWSVIGLAALAFVGVGGLLAAIRGTPAKKNP